MTPLTSLNVLASQHMRVRGPRIRLRRTLDGACWVNVDGIETDSEDDAIDEQVHQSVDTICTISPRRQWREALLYNFGQSLSRKENTRGQSLIECGTNRFGKDEVLPQEKCSVDSSATLKFRLSP